MNKIQLSRNETQVEIIEELERIENMLEEISMRKDVSIKANNQIFRVVMRLMGMRTDVKYLKTAEVNKLCRVNQGCFDDCKTCEHDPYEICGKFEVV